MKSKIVLFFTIIVCFLMQSTVLHLISIGSITPNLLLILCVSMGLMRGRKSGLWTGFFCGLLVDLFYGSVFGFYALIYMYVGFFSGYAFRIYYDDDIKEAYKRVEYVASKKMVDKLPDYMKKHYEKLFFPQEDKAYEWRLVKAADKLSALIKCKQELNSGNQEFKTAYETTKKALHDMNMEEVEVFMQDFLPAYDLTLDELQAK